jgi:hypothetical protein
VIKRTRQRLGGHVALLVKKNLQTKFWIESLNERNLSEDGGINGRNMYRMGRQYFTSLAYGKPTHPRAPFCIKIYKVSIN